MKLSNQVAVITGASEGIGAAIARRFAREGARVVLAARSEEKLKALAEELGSERALAVPTDVTDAEQVKRLMARTREHFGGLDILVNNAGVGLYASVAEMAWADFEQMWKVNFFGVVRCIREALPDLCERRGVVVNISSVAGKLAIPYLTGYCASKFALNAFSTGLRMELTQAGVRVELHIVTQRTQLPRPKMRRGTCLDPDPARLKRCKEGQHPRPLQTPPHNDFAIFINAMDLENRLRDIQSNCPDLFHCSPPG